jgi:hypothetical protein
LPISLFFPYFYWPEHFSGNGIRHLWQQDAMVAEEKGVLIACTEAGTSQGKAFGYYHTTKI